MNSRSYVLSTEKKTLIISIYSLNFIYLRTIFSLTHFKYSMCLNFSTTKDLRRVLKILALKNANCVGSVKNIFLMCYKILSKENFSEVWLKLFWGFFQHKTYDRDPNSSPSALLHSENGLLRHICHYMDWIAHLEACSVHSDQ